MCFQAKTIGDGFMKSFEDRGSEITATEITSLGDFIVVVANPLLKELETETAKKAVRLMGASRLYQRLPKGLKQEKTKRALEILVSCMFFATYIHRIMHHTYVIQPTPSFQAPFTLVS